ncbi:hypothetical protein KL905_000824 [Ogataea polymorpha]|uniref:Uncharacterized protein n=1 Tax=Ogataea polymorpha TaxID=460523 RepID=A0A1B7SGQ5_9ASCO|nr:uncharacterized protein OGAPODRAFT_100323 [Ogataea polymorpha]KAG7893982.1 hypothetical protein KL908_002259 [Ogataea polymorpha]KAG7918482.1 hypothetical protein KL927_001939 [Ogataea polymorpha]KAG7923606.1 hypothetical protein KL905_000824 [Ogataea polymorpha]KAG7927816.1 hypothetical protein KL925_002174 [Ogataea polymorpha]KAG7933482.1 hypothetical protein KL934_003292 [Ogataea polymorpha]
MSSLTVTRSAIERAKRSRDWSLGLFFLFCVVGLWVSSSVLLNDLFEKDIYSKPFFITWINTASFALYLIPYHLSNHTEFDLDAEYPPLTVKETIQLAFWFCTLWFLSNLVTNASLLYTSVSSQTILSSTSSFFTMLVGAFFLIERINKTKLVSIVMSFVGVVLVTRNDDPSPTETKQYVVMGNILALSGAFLYGVYSILLKLKIKNDSRIDMRLFFGFVGIFNLLFLWPPLVLLDKIGYEKFELPPTSYVYFVVIFNCAISFLADFLWARAMLLTSPLTVTLGLSLTIPFAMLCDFVFKHKVNSGVYIMGALFICLSFYFVNKSESEQ